MTGGTRSGASGSPEREGATVRALERAEDATADAVRHLHAAADLEWSGGAAVRYRAALDDVLDAVGHTQALLDGARAAMAEHAASTEAVRWLAPAAGALVPAGWFVPAPVHRLGVP